MERTKQFNPWLIWLPAALFALFMVLLQTSMSVMIQPLRKSFLLDSFGIGLLSASFYYTYALLQVPIGAFVDRFGARKVLLLSVSGTAVSCIGFAFSYTFLWASLFRILMGLSCASAITCAFFIGAVWFEKKYFPVIVGLSEASAMLGGAFSAKLLTPSVASFGWRITFILCFCFAVFLFILTFYLVRDRKESQIYVEHPERKINIFKNLVFVIKSGQAWLCGIYSGFMFLPLSIVGYLWGVQFVMTGYGETLDQAGTSIALIFIGAVIGNPFVGYIAEKFNWRKQVMLLCAFLELIMCSIFIYYPVITGFYLYILMFFIGFLSTSYMIPFSIVKEHLPDYTCATAMAFINVLCGCIGSLLFQPLTGWILSRTAVVSGTTGILEPNKYSFMYALSILPVCFILSIILVFLICRKKTIVF